MAQTVPVSITVTPASGPYCGSAVLSALTETGTTAQIPPGGTTTGVDCSCPVGYVAVGIQGRTGSWVDQFSLICQQINSSGTLFGATVLSTANGTSPGGGPVGPFNLPAGNIMVGAAVYYINQGGSANYLEAVGLRGQTPAYVLASNNNSTSPTTATDLSGNQTKVLLNTTYAPNGSVITGMKSFDGGIYSGGVQWIYTPIAQLMADYVWGPGGETTKTITVTTSNTYTLTATAGHATGTDSKTITINPIPGPPTSFTTTDAEVCQGDNNVAYTVSAVAGASSYSWSYSGTGATITGTTNSVTISFSSSATSGNLSVTANTAAGCSSTSISTAVTVTTSVPGRPGNGVTGSSTVCQGQSGVAYTVPTATGATSYTWTTTAPNAVINSTNTTSVTLDFPANATSGTLFVSGTNACGNSTQNRNLFITVNPLPTIPSTITSNPATPCATSTGTTYTVTNVSGDTYAWSYSGTGATITSGSTSNSITVTYNGATNGTWTVTPSNSCGTGLSPRTLAVSLSANPASPSSFTTSDATVCEGDNNVAYSIPAVSGATSYTWNYTGTGATISGGTTNSVTINYSATATSGNLVVVADNAAGCASPTPLSMAVTVSTIPGRPGSGVTGSSPVCQGTTGSYTVPVASGATSYSWSYSGTGATINGTGNSITVDFDFTATGGALTVFAVNGCGLSSQSRVGSTITVHTAPAQPSAIVVGTPSPCNTSNPASTYSVSTVSGATGYSWTYSGSGFGIVSGSNTHAITAKYTNGTDGTLTLTATNASGCSSPTSTYDVALQYTGTWTGNSSTNWATTGNWGCGTAPIATTDVTIPGTVTNMPTNSGAAVTKSLTISPSATLTNAAGGTITVSGNWTNNGTFTDNNIYSNTGFVSIAGGTAQTIGGTTATTFSDLKIANTSGGVALNSTATVNGVLTLTSGAFATNGNLNQNLYNGAIAGTGAGTVTGNIRFFKYIYGDRYHYLSSPIAGVNLTDWNDNVPLVGHLYSYDETQKDTSAKVGWTAVSSGTIGTMTGYALFFPRWYYETTVDVTGSYTHSSAGSIASGSLSNTKTTLPVVNAAADGWHLVGNPYPSTVDWGAIVAGNRSNLDNAIYSYDNRNNRYVSYVNGLGTNGGTQYIGSMQGFFVKVNVVNGSGSLTIPSSARVTSTLKDVWRTEEPVDKKISLIVANGTKEDEMVVRFRDDASEQFDSEVDAYKLINDAGVPSIFSCSPGVNYSINSLPSSLAEKTIPLQLNVESDTLCTWTADLSGFQNYETVTLEDRLLGTSQDLTTSPTYSIQLNKGVYTNRFFIQYSNGERTITGTTNASLSNSGIEIGAYQQDVFLLFTDENPGSANIGIFDALGKKVYEVQNANTSSGRIDISMLDVSNGIYIVKVQTPAATKSQQIILQK